MRRSVSMLDRSIRRLAPILKAMASTNGGGPVAGRRRRPNLTPKQRAALKLQGRYMGFIRQLRPRQKAEVRKIRQLRGINAAVQRAEQLARR
jgi:hypothetical protein